MFRPPVNRAMRSLDRLFFKRTLPTSAARVTDRKQITKCKSDLYLDILKLDRMQTVVSVRDPQGEDAKALLLKPEIRSDGNWLLLTPIGLRFSYPY
jgi:tRNA (guanine37-N1)-methyltransferase